MCDRKTTQFFHSINGPTCGESAALNQFTFHLYDLGRSISSHVKGALYNDTIEKCEMYERLVLKSLRIVRLWHYSLSSSIFSELISKKRERKIAKNWKVNRRKRSLTDLKLQGPSQMTRDNAFWVIADTLK